MEFGLPEEQKTEPEEEEPEDELVPQRGAAEPEAIQTIVAPLLSLELAKQSAAVPPEVF